MIHIDIKKLGRFERVGHCITGNRKGQGNPRGVGWEFVHACIDDALRIAFCLPTHRQKRLPTSMTHLRRQSGFDKTFAEMFAFFRPLNGEVSLQTRLRFGQKHEMLY